MKEKGLWQRHMLVRLNDKRQRQSEAYEAIGGLMGGFMSGMMGASLHERMRGVIEEKKDRQRKH